jgi:hypothetical protein
MECPKPKPNEMSDAELLRAYQQTTGGVHDMVANALLIEIQRRNLDI